MANKGIPYDTADIDALTLLYDKMWSLLQKQEQDIKLEESEARFHQLFNTMKEGVAIYRAVEEGEDFEFVDINNAGLSYGNKELKEVIGKRISQVYPGVKEIKLFDVLREVYKTGEPKHLPLVHYKDDQVEEWVENYVFKLPSGLVVAVYEDTTERHREEERYKTIVQTTMDGFWLLDADGNPLDVNDAYCRMSGYTREELLTISVPRIDAKESEEAFKQHLKQVMKEGYTRFETRHRKKDGTIFDVDISVTYVPFGKEGQCIVFLRDITERKKIETLLAENEEKFRTVFKESPIGKELYNAKGELLEVNKACLELFGVTDTEQIKGFNLFDDPNVTEEQKEKLRNKERIRYEVAFDFERVKSADLYATKKSNSIFLDVLINPLMEKTGTALRGYLVQVIDITNQKQLEKKLEEDRFRLSAIVEGTNAGTWEWNVQTEETRFNEKWAEMIGYTLEELSPISINTWKKYTHPDDFTKSEMLLEKHFRGESEYYQCECRMIHKNGYWVWVLDRGKVLTWTDDGKPEWMYGTHQEITDRRNAEKRLEYERIFLNTVLDNIKEAIIICNEKGEIIRFNESARRLHNLPEKRIPSDQWAGYYDLYYSDGSAPLATEDIPLFRALQGEEVVNSEIMVIPKGREPRLLSCNGHQLIDSEGEIAGAVVAMHDITEYKRIEKDLRNALEAKDFLMKELNHRVKNNLSMITSLINLKNAEIDADLSDIENQVRAILLIHEKLQQSDDVGKITLDAYMYELLETVFSSFPGRTVKITVSSDDIALETRKAVSLGLIINEIATNAMKHGFKNRENPEFSVKAELDNEDNCVITLSNNGAPFPEDVDLDNPETLGLRLVSALVEQLEGTVELQRETHPVFAIRFPM